MLTHDEKRWIVDASRADILFERVFGYDRIVAKKFSYLCLYIMAPISGFYTLMLLLMMFVIKPIPDGPSTSAYSTLAFCVSVTVAALGMGMMFWRLERKPYRERSVEQIFELQLLLLPEVMSNRRLLWKHRKAISKYLLSFSNDSTLELGTTFSWRKKQLERRDKAKADAYMVLASMGVPASRIVEHIDGMMVKLREQEIAAVDRYSEMYAPGTQQYHFYGYFLGDPDEHLEELKKAKIVIENPAHPLALEM